MSTNPQGLQEEDKNFSLPWTRENSSALYLQKSQIPLSLGESCSQKSSCHSTLPVNFQLIPDQRESSAGLQSWKPCLSLLLLCALAVHQQPREHSWGKGRNLFLCSGQHLRHRAGELETHSSPCSAKGFSLCCTIDNSRKNVLTPHSLSSPVSLASGAKTVWLIL